MVDKRKNRPMEPVEDRFMRSVNKLPNGGCWLWTAGKTRGGYGHMSVGRKPDQNRFVRSHRLSWTLFRGEIPQGMLVLHRCDVPACVNPDHLFIGTTADNVKDMVQKGRHKHLSISGPGNPNAKLSASQNAEIHRRGNGGEKVSDLAAEFGVGKTTVRRAMARGADWSCPTSF